MQGKYIVGDTVLGNWTLVRQIGEGSFGQVFEGQREDFGRIYRSAIKIITIPQSQSEVKSARADGMDEEGVSTYYKAFVEQLIDEFDLMERLKGNTNVVNYEDHSTKAHDEGIGWDIIIRMELLTPFVEYVAGRTMSRQDVIRFGIDICKALELCWRHNIIHRDVKPENIFVTENGDFKLGDFGIARMAEKTSGGMSKKGTYSYMAPEVYKEEPYGAGVDIYSLGLVLYWLLNDRRTPFLPPVPTPITPTDRNAALHRRIKGEEIPAPRNADPQLSAIVLKACAYDPKQRYSDPTQMRKELEALAVRDAETAAPASANTSAVTATGNFRGEKTELITPTEKTQPLTPSKTEAAIPQPSVPKLHSANPSKVHISFKHPRKKRLGAGIAAALALVGCVGVFFALKGNNKSAQFAVAPDSTTSDSKIERARATLPDFDSVVHQEAVAELYDRGVITPSEWFPDWELCRDEWAQLLYRAVAGTDDTGTWWDVQTDLTDISDTPHEGYITRLWEMGYLYGDPIYRDPVSLDALLGCYYYPWSLIEVREAAEMVLKAMGEPYSDVMTTARDLGLIDNDELTAESYLDIDTAALMLVALVR